MITKTHRILICLGILAVDLVVFFLPLTALFIVYIILVNPPWFREFLNHLNDGPDPPDLSAMKMPEKGD